MNCPPGSIVFTVTDKGITEAVIVRRLTYEMYMVVPKYVYVGDRAARLLDTYSANEVHRAAELAHVVKIRSPLYGVDIPIVLPNRDTFTCLNSFDNNLSFLLGKAGLHHLRGLLASGCIGLTGSLLAGHWSPRFSDVDILVDVSPNCINVFNDLVELVSPLPQTMRDNWLRREAAKRKQGIGNMSMIATRWQRGIINGRVVSIAPVSRRLREAPETRVFEPSSEVGEVSICLEPYLEELGDYPAIIGDENGCVVVYDGFYIPRLLEGGCFRARGPVVYVSVPGRFSLKCVSVGGAEGGFIELLGSS